MIWFNKLGFQKYLHQPVVEYNVESVRGMAA